MRRIGTFDSKDYDPSWELFKRDSSRAIIFHEGKLVMIRSEKYGDYKFPGGGIEAGESLVDALIRETLEETGLSILQSSIEEYGEFLIRRKAFDEDKIFEQVSYYFTCELESAERKPVSLDVGYEQEYAYKLVRCSPEEAIAANEKLTGNDNIPWVSREILVLKELLLR